MTQADNPVPKSLRQGRKARIKARADKAVAQRLSGPAFLTRKVAPLEVLDEDGLVLIERNADRILAEIGMDFRGDPEMLEVFRKAGCDVRGERVRLVAALQYHHTDDAFDPPEMTERIYGVPLSEHLGPKAPARVADA